MTQELNYKQQITVTVNTADSTYDDLGTFVSRRAIGAILRRAAAAAHEKPDAITSLVIVWSPDRTK